MNNPHMLYLAQRRLALYDLYATTRKLDYEYRWHTNPRTERRKVLGEVLTALRAYFLYFWTASGFHRRPLTARGYLGIIESAEDVSGFLLNATPGHFWTICPSVAPSA